MTGCEGALHLPLYLMWGPVSCGEINLGRQVGQGGAQERPCLGRGRGASSKGKSRGSSLPFHLEGEGPGGCASLQLSLKRTSL